MRHIRTAALAAACLATPVITRAQAPTVPGAPNVVGTPFSVNGLVLVGTQAGGATRPFGSLIDYVLESVAHDDRIAGVYRGVESSRSLSGTLCTPACPAGCAAVTGLYPHDYGDAGFGFSGSLGFADPARFDPRIIGVSLTYPVPHDLGGLGTESAVFTLTAVPESAPLALAAAGIGGRGLHGAARRGRN